MFSIFLDVRNLPGRIKNMFWFFFSEYTLLCSILCIVIKPSQGYWPFEGSENIRLIQHKFNSYLNGQTFSSHPLPLEVPQRLVLGHILFAIYSTFLSPAISLHGKLMANAFLTLLCRHPTLPALPIRWPFEHEHLKNWATPDSEYDPARPTPSSVTAVIFWPAFPHAPSNLYRWCRMQGMWWPFS